MARFRTHLVVAAAVSGAAAAWLADRGDLDGATGLGCAALGTVGGLLPDLDAVRSRPSRMVWTAVSAGMALAIGLTAWTAGEPGLSIPLAGLTFSMVRVVGPWLFARLTTHRGIWHSVPAALAWGLGWIWMGVRWWPATPPWTAGAFLTGGYLVHLLLDEASSVDLRGIRTKRSFGTALKLWAPDNPLGSLAVYALVAGLAWRLG